MIPDIKHKAEALLFALLKAKEDGNHSWENINNHFQDVAWDRRFKVWFGSCANDLHGFWRVGSTTFIVEFRNGKGYARTYTYENIYKKMPCWECELTGSYSRNFGMQSEVLI